MGDIFSPALFLYLVPAVFAVTGGIMAYNRGRNPLLWGIGSAIFPICIMIVWFEKPKKEVAGHFKRCCKCEEWIKWKENPCRYCGAEQSKF
ncbi:MAG: hypothetical protein HXX17_04250 [Geobacteraceae bacterium]|nr:hypothetical protein [Geobacteraceae bacterium]